MYLNKFLKLKLKCDLSTMFYVCYKEKVEMFCLLHKNDHYAERRSDTAWCIFLKQWWTEPLRCIKMNFICFLWQTTMFYNRLMHYINGPCRGGGGGGQGGWWMYILQNCFLKNPGFDFHLWLVLVHKKNFGEGWRKTVIISLCRRTQILSCKVVLFKYEGHFMFTDCCALHCPVYISKKII